MKKNLTEEQRKRVKAYLQKKTKSKKPAVVKGKKWVGKINSDKVVDYYLSNKIYRGL